MKKHLTFFIFFCACSVSTLVSGQRLQVHGVLETDTLLIKNIHLENGNANQLLLSDATGLPVGQEGNVLSSTQNPNQQSWQSINTTSFSSFELNKFYPYLNYRDYPGILKFTSIINQLNFTLNDYYVLEQGELHSDNWDTNGIYEIGLNARLLNETGVSAGSLAYHRYYLALSPSPDPEYIRSHLDLNTVLELTLHRDHAYAQAQSKKIYVRPPNKSWTLYVIQKPVSITAGNADFPEPNLEATLFIRKIK